MKNIGVTSMFALLALLAPAGKAAPTISPAVSSWIDATLAGEKATLPKDVTSLKAARVKPAQTRLWNAYTAAAKRAGWHKQLLPVPKTIRKHHRGGKKTKIVAATLKSGDLEMPYTFIAKGKKPASGWPMFICLHGGGKYHGPEKINAHGWHVNSGEWQAQMNLTAGVYKPAGLYFIPRMADDRLGRWWHKHNIDIFTRMIRLAILFNDVDPNKIYLMGISQGGYGTCHLAPFMADHLAAAGSMAGGMMTVTENLRNLPFRSDIGENDTMYKRIELAKQLHAAIDARQTTDPEGYTNILAIQKGRGHGIDYSKSPTWLARHTRNPHPDKIVWRCHQKDGIYRKHFYWLSLTDTPEYGDEYELTATLDRTKNTVNITAYEFTPPAEKDANRKPLTSSRITVHLSDDMLNLDKPVTIILNGTQAFHGKLQRKASTILRNIVTRGDPNYAFPAEVTVGTLKTNTP